MSDNPYRQKAPLPGQSVDWVPDESPITLGDMIRQHGGDLNRAKTEHRNRVAKKALAPAPTPTPTPEAQRTFDLNKTLEELAYDTWTSFDSLPEGEIDDQTSLAEMLKRDREKFQGLYGNDRVEAVAGAGGRREDPSQPWPDEKKNWVHGTLDELRESTGGSWEINYEGKGGEIEFIDLNTGETTSEVWDGEQ